MGGSPMRLPRRKGGPQRPRSDVSLLCEEIRNAVRSEAYSAISSGRAEEFLLGSDDDPVLLLEPKAESAAPLEIEFDTPYLVNCSPGRNGMSIEIFSNSKNDLEDQVRGLVRAVLNGRYMERVYDDPKRPKIVAEWDGGQGSQRALLNTLPPRNVDGWRAAIYEPY